LLDGEGKKVVPNVAHVRKGGRRTLKGTEGLVYIPGGKKRKVAQHFDGGEGREKKNRGKEKKRILSGSC